MLTSTKNPRIQRIRKLQSSARTRRVEGSFVVEGIRLAEEALDAGWNPEFIIYTPDINPRGQQVVDGFASKGTEVLPVAPHVMQAASDTQTPQGILALLPLQALPIPESPDFIVIPDGVRDPGNLGSILRTALAAGVDAILLPPGNVDPLSPKVLRAGMGAHFKLPVHQMGWDEINSVAESRNLAAYLADSSGGCSFHETDFQFPLALLIGGEAAGAGGEAHKLATRRVHIPMTGEVESLNSAVAAALLMFEVVRQRRLPVAGGVYDE
jgi:TrmH family RNA methyltransferase